MDWMVHYRSNAPNSSQPAGFDSFSMSELYYEKKSTAQNIFFYNTMPTKITQNMNLYTAHVINIFRKLFTALYLVNI